MDGGKYEAILEENLLETLKHTKQFTKQHKDSKHATRATVGW